MPRQQPFIIDGRAPMAQVQSGLRVGTGGSSLTDPLTWANKFRRNDQQLAAFPTSIPQGQTAATMQRPMGITQSVLQELQANPFNNSVSLNLNQPLQFGTAQPAAVPPLTQLASGGKNHAQSWLDNARAGQKRVAPYSDPSKPFSTSWGQPDQNYQWASAFRR